MVNFKKDYKAYNESEFGSLESKSFIRNLGVIISAFVIIIAFGIKFLLSLW